MPRITDMLRNLMSIKKLAGPIIMKMAVGPFSAASIMIGLSRCHQLEYKEENPFRLVFHSWHLHNFMSTINISMFTDTRKNFASVPYDTNVTAEQPWINTKCQSIYCHKMSH